MKKLILSFITFASLTVFAQEPKIIADPTATVRKLNGTFTAISVTDGIDLYLTQGQEESCAVSVSDEKYRDRFKTDIENGVLKLYYDTKGIDWGIHMNRKLRAYVTFKILEKLTASGGSTVKGTGALTVTNLEMKFTGGSHFEGQLNAKEMTVEQSSGSGINVSGKTEKIKVETNSGAVFKGYEFVTDYCDVKTSSGASVHITINKELIAKANSGGSIKYKGEGLIRDVNISSGGIVKKEK